MADPLRIQCGVAFAREFHQIDAAARGIHFLVPENVRGTDRQAEAAVDTIFDNLFGGRMVLVERAGQWNCVRKSSHERSLLAFTREHNRMAVLLANVGREKRRKRKDNAETQSPLRNRETAGGTGKFDFSRSELLDCGQSGLPEVVHVFEDGCH